MVQNLSKKFSQITEYWTPIIVGELNGQYLKLAKFKGEFIWHHHQDEDELFWVVKGEIMIETKTQNYKLKEGEFLVIPKGIEHKPSAQKEAWVAMLEPKSTLNTGNIINDLTKKDLKKFNETYSLKFLQPLLHSSFLHCPFEV